jgi:glycosyltransferase involved in cell wall biosynthesis
MCAFRTAFVSVVPSPYQRDIFRALSQRPEIALNVYYLEAAAPDSPWPEEPLQAYETILRGRWFSIANARFHLVTQFPPLKDYPFVILNSLTSTLAQWTMRLRSSHQQVLFWGEQLRTQTSFLRQTVQKHLSAPISKTDAIVAIGSVAERSYRSAFPNLTYFNIPYHCELQPFSEQPANLHPRGEEIVFLFCGQIIARKGVDLLVAAFDRLITKGFRARLILVGRRADLDWALTFCSPKSRELIEYVGFCDPKKLPHIYAKAHIFVLPSRYDGWGVVVNQALGAGLPIICSDAVGAGYDLVLHGVNGFRVTAGSVEELTDAMEAFLKSPQLVLEYGAASLRLGQDWTPARGAQKWISALAQLDQRQ